MRASAPGTRLEYSSRSRRTTQELANKIATFVRPRQCSPAGSGVSESSAALLPVLPTRAAPRAVVSIQRQYVVIPDDPVRMFRTEFVKCAMETLFDLCSLIRSKNAGPFVLTFI